MTLQQPPASRAPGAVGGGVVALQDRERFLAAIVESADDAIFAKTLDGTILSWNAGAQRMYGYTPEETVGNPVSMLAPPEGVAEIREILSRLRRGLRIEHFETTRVRKNGERFPVSLAISPVRDASGTIIGASTVARDITDQRRLADALALQKSLLASQSEASIEGILVIDPSGRVLFVNHRFGELWGYDDELIAGGTDEALVEAAARLVDEPEAFRARVRQLYGNREERARDEVRLRDGRVFDRYTAPVRSEEGAYFGRVWFFRDITLETMRAAQLQAVIAAVQDAAIVFDAQGRALLRNPAAERWLPNIDRFDDLVVRVGLPDGPTGSPRSEPGASALSLSRAGQIEIPIAVDGDVRHVLVSARPIVLPSDDFAQLPAPLGTLVLLRDVSELREAQLSREAFLGVLSHELRTPITTIFGASKMLERSGDSAVRLELLHDIVAESDRLYRLVEDLLVLTRIERESLAVSNGPVRIAPVIERVVAAERTANPATRLEVEIGPRLPIVLGEETYLEQVLRNLIGNAIKYGPRSGLVTVRAERTPGDGVAVRVLDDGPGIANGERDRVFDLLYRSPATAAQAAGSGIGLFVSRRLAEAMRGRLSASSRPTGGSEFVLELTQYDESEDLVGAD